MKSPNGKIFCALITLMVILLQVHFVVGRFEDLSVYGSHEINQLREEFTDTIRPSWRWRNRNYRRRNKRNRFGAMRGSRKRSDSSDYTPYHDLIFPFESIDSCCPTVYEVIEPIAGRNRTGHLVELYQDDRVRQRFYEISCNPKVLNKPCKFLESRHSQVSQCIQQHSLTYALVRPPGARDDEHPWALDYISTRSGCTCQVVNFRRMRKRKPRY